jgi:transcriptional regulator with XRE-family HTH domain
VSDRVADSAEQIGRGIRNLRKQRRWKQDVLAQESGISRVTISLAENAKTNLSLFDLERLAVALNTTVNGLFSAGRLSLRNTDEDLKALFARNVHMRREYMGLSRSALADAVGLLPQYISTTENARRLPALPNFLLLSWGLKVSPGVLLRKSLTTDALAAIYNRKIEPFDIVNRMKRERVSLNLSRMDVARRTGLDPVHLSAIESGKHYPSLMTVIAFCTGFGLEVETFLEGD